MIIPSRDHKIRGLEHLELIGTLCAPSINLAGIRDELPIKIQGSAKIV